MTRIRLRRSPLRMPTNWGLAPVKALKWIEENMIPYPLGEFKTVEGAG